MAISPHDRKLLWGRSGNRCSNCRQRLVEPETTHDRESVVGDECHITAQSPGGPRSSDPVIALDVYDNLILLCKRCHKMVDDQPGYFSSKILHELKSAHESWVEQSLEISLESSDNHSRARTPVLVEPVSSGKELLPFIANAQGYSFSYDEPSSKEEAELLAGYAQDLADWCDAYEDIGPGERIRIAHSMNTTIEGIHADGLSLLAGQFQQHVNGVLLNATAFVMKKRSNNSGFIPVEERLRRQEIIGALKREYILSHDGISPGLLAGTEALPKDWVEMRLKAMGEEWQQERYI